MKDWLKYAPSLLLLLSGLWNLNSSMQRQYDQIKQVVDIISVIELPKATPEEILDASTPLVECPEGVCVPGELPATPEPPKVEPKVEDKDDQPALPKRIVRQHTPSYFICPACIADERSKIPYWLNAGYTYEQVKHSRNSPNVDLFGKAYRLYPWYEVYDSDGNYSSTQTLPTVPKK
jgi:hypothetical protein